MGLGMFLFAAVDMQAKFLTETLHPLQIGWTRQSGLLVGAIALLAIRGAGPLRTRQPGLQVLRGAMVAMSTMAFIVAIQHVPLADAFAVSFVAPLVVTVLAALFLREPVGRHRWIAVVLGFLGTLVVLRPGLGVLHPASGLVVLAASGFAMRQLLSRRLARTDDTSTAVVYTAFVGSFLLTLPLPFVWQWPSSGLEIALCISIAVLAALGEFCVIRALEVAMAVVVAPVQYSLMIWGTLYGWLVFHQLPDMWTWVGTAVIIGTGLYTLRREYLAVRRARAQSGETR